MHVNFSNGESGVSNNCLSSRAFWIGPYTELTMKHCRTGSSLFNILYKFIQVLFDIPTNLPPQSAPVTLWNPTRPLLFSRPNVATRSTTWSLRLSSSSYSNLSSNECKLRSTLAMRSIKRRKTSVSGDQTSIVLLAPASMAWLASSVSASSCKCIVVEMALRRGFNDIVACNHQILQSTKLGPQSFRQMSRNSSFCRRCG